MLTRNTKLYKITSSGKKKKDILYRDLNSIEYAFLNNIKNQAIRAEIAGYISIYNSDPNDVPLGIKIQIGNDVISRVESLLTSKQLFEITVNEFRDHIKHDDALMAIKQILSCLPGQSITELLKLNIKDLLEIVCLCELLINKPLFDFHGKRSGLVNTKDLPDDGKSLQEKMNTFSHLGIK